MFSQAMEPHPSGVLLPPGYTPLLDSAIEVLEADERVRAAWVHGSLARGEGDALSDLDVIVAVDDDTLVEFGASWRERLDAITPTVMARKSFGDAGSWLSITPSCQRFDFWAEPVANVAESAVRDRHLLFDRDGLAPLVPPPLPPADPSPEKFEQLRGWYASCAAVLGANPGPLLTTEVIHTLRWILYEAYVESNRPIEAKSVKRWSAKLTDAQRERLVVLPAEGDPAPVMVALDEVLGPLIGELPDINVGHAVIPPEGLIRGMHLLAEPEPSRARHVAEEFFAIHLYLTLVIHRDDWLLGHDGINLVRHLLYELDLEENGRVPATSPRDWDGRLTDEQRAELLKLPTGPPTADGVIDGHLAVRAAFVARGRAVLGDDWPSDMEGAVCDQVDAHVDAYRARAV